MGVEPRVYFVLGQGDNRQRIVQRYNEDSLVLNRVSGFIIIITGALVRISEYHIILYILIKSR